jgi:hypothetical protein
MLCQGGSTRATRPSRDMGQWLGREINTMGRLPECYLARLEWLQYCAFNASGWHGATHTTEASRRHIRAVLKTLIEELRVSVAGYRAALATFDLLESLGSDLPCTRDELISESAASERKSLAFDMAWETV